MSKKSNSMTKEAASRIQSANAKSNNGNVSKGSFPARAQSSADKGKK